MSRPSRRETLTPCLTEAVKLIDVRVVCVPTVGSTSSHCASKRPTPGMISSGVGRPAWLSIVRRYFESVCVPPRMTPSRKRAGIWPLPSPPVEVATSLPAAERDDGDDHGGGWQAELHDGLLRRGSAGPYFRPNPSRATEVRPPAPSAVTSPNPRTQAARIGGRRQRWEPDWHADHAHPHRSRQDQH